MEYSRQATTLERTVCELADEVDFWKEESLKWKTKYQEEVQLNNQMSNERMEDAKNGVRNALMFAFSVRDDENGNLVIPSENRKDLADLYTK